MQTITAITAQKRSDDRVNIFLDGAYAFSLAAIIGARLQVGQTLEREAIDRLRLEDEYERARDAAMRLIVQRPRSVREVTQRLGRRDFAPKTIEQVVDRLQELDLLDDLAFARYWVEQRETFKPRSPRALRQELAQKGVARGVIDEVVAGVDAEGAARKAAQSRVNRWVGLPEELFFQKMAGYLQRRGFGYEMTKQITEEMWQVARSISEGDSA